MKNVITLFISILIAGFAQKLLANTNLSNYSITDNEQILIVLKKAIKKQHHIDATLTIHYLKIYKNWAYIETSGGGDPGINAVLQKQNNHWEILYPSVPCNPICPDHLTSCADSELICKNSLQKQFPTVPHSIFPIPNYKKMIFTPI